MASASFMGGIFPLVAFYPKLDARIQPSRCHSEPPNSELDFLRPPVDTGAMHVSKVLTDSRRNVSVPEWKFSSEELGGGTGPWSVVKRTLAGGRQSGVEVIEVDNGVLQFTVVPTRGLNVWTAMAGDELRLGWDSPVQEIVHPQFVNLAERGGLGWLDGFGEWICRCGLESFGPPCQDGGQTLTLHGRINYLPASRVEVVFESAPVARLVIRGTVDETLMFGPQLRLSAEIVTEIGQPALTLNDTVTNLGDGPQEMQLLYHLNFGPPLLGAGAEFVAPVKRVAPRDARAAEGMSRWNLYAGPQPPGYREEVYLAELHADPDGRTEAALKSPDGSKGALVSFNVQELPYMVLWKNEAPAKSGYVTGLEPATGFPYSRPVERAAGRVSTLAAGQRYHAQVTITALTSREAVRNVVTRIDALRHAEPEISHTPLQS
ncbi:MAG: aldose 1-epimerase family protein [Verrucomicrobia bacterium]|nr:aldose 1-epimerase family protein [Verrucomicrobiota bacterium]